MHEIEAAGQEAAAESPTRRDERQRRDRTAAGNPRVDARRFVSLATAAAYADVSTRTLRRYISHGRLTGYRVGPRLVKVDLTELDRLVRPIPTARCPD